MQRYAGAGITFLVGIGLQLTGWANEWVGVALLVLAAVWGGLAWRASRKPSDDKGVRIVHAAWGYPGHFADVTRVVRGAVAAGKLRIHASNEDLVGSVQNDPAPGIRKTLVVQWALDGVGQGSAFFPEDDTAFLPLPKSYKAPSAELASAVEATSSAPATTSEVRVRTDGGTPVKATVSLTQAQYDALDPPDPDTLYVIVDKGQPPKPLGDVRRPTPTQLAFLLDSFLLKIDELQQQSALITTASDLHAWRSSAGGVTHEATRLAERVGQFDSGWGGEIRSYRTEPVVVVGPSVNDEHEGWKRELVQLDRVLRRIRARLG